MITAEFSTASLSRTRLSASPIVDMIRWFTLASTGQPHPLLNADHVQVRWLLRDHNVQLLASLLSVAERAKYVPDFLQPMPERGAGSSAIGAPIEQVSATTDSDVDQQLAELALHAGHLPAVLTTAYDSSHLQTRLADAMQQLWKQAFADVWSKIRYAIDADIHARALTAAQHGIGTMLASLHPAMQWHDNTLAMPMTFQEHVLLGDADIVLVPSITRWPSYSVQLCDPANQVITYPVRTAAAIRDASTDHTKLLGTGRASILNLLRVPRTTRNLSRAAGLAESTTSHHLGVLLRAGLATRQRTGREVLYAATPAGLLLLETAS